jgi:hypothetical protein
MPSGLDVPWCVQPTLCSPLAEARATQAGFVDPHHQAGLGAYAFSWRGMLRMLMAWHG